MLGGLKGSWDAVLTKCKVREIASEYFHAPVDRGLGTRNTTDAPLLAPMPLLLHAPHYIPGQIQPQSTASWDRKEPQTHNPYGI